MTSSRISLNLILHHVQEIISQHKTYIECYLRLACICRRMGAASDALQWATRALDLEGGHADALALMSQLYMEKR